MIKLDGFGKACPLPVIMVKNEIESKNFNKEDVLIKVDNEVAVKNLEKLSKNYKAKFSYEEIEGGYQVTINTKDVEGKLISDIDIDEFIPDSNIVSYFITHETIGSGDDELGANLMSMLTYSILQMPTLPKVICMMNAGVKLATINEETIKNFKELEEKGVRILVCGACLQFYGLKDSLKVGEVSNAYEILTNLQKGTVINL